MTVHVPQIFSPKYPLPLYGDATFSIVVLTLAAIADGTSFLHGIPSSPEVNLLLKVLGQMGVEIEQNGTDIVVHGHGRYGLRKPETELNAGESGLVLRALTGLLCGQEFESVLVAEGTLSRRSLVRMLEPLSAMGAQIAASYKHTPPLRIFGRTSLQPIQYAFPLPNFYLKFPLLLAALYANAPSEIIEPVPSISHVENLLLAAVREEKEYHVDVTPGEIQPFRNMNMPLDTEIADLLLITAILQGRSLSLENILLNPTRGTVVNALQEWEVVRINLDADRPDVMGTISVPPSIQLPEQIVLSGAETRRFKSSIPMLAALCAGQNVELRVQDGLDIRQQQCDWIAALVDGLSSFGADMEELDDGFILRGGSLHGAGVVCYNDETIALALLGVAAAVGDDTWLYEVPDTPRVRLCLTGNNIPFETSL